jgi:hypothetical protein
MKTGFLISFNGILALITVNLLVACQPKSVDSERAPVTKQFGTSDTGGGTGIDNKVYESYIVDITKHPAFLNYVKPLLVNIKDADGKSNSNPETENKFLAYKTWYIAPVDLEKVGKETLGVSFQANETQQIARQTKREIWIDSRIFEKMSLKDQGDLILHEMIMSMYFVKFMTYTELCQIGTMTTKVDGKETTTDCTKVPDIFKNSFKPEESRPLNAEDNENIRYVTGWILQNGTSEINQIELIKLLRTKKFDKRLFNPENYKKNGESSEIKLETTGRAIFDAMKATELSGFLPNICKDLGSEAKQNCRIEVSEGKIDYPPVQLPSIRAKVFIEDKLVYDFEVIMSDKHSIYGVKDEDGTIAYALSMSTQKYPENLKLGDKFTTGFFLFRQEGTKEGTLRLDSVVARTFVLVSTKPVGKFECETRTPKWKSVFDTGMLIQRDGQKIELAEDVYQSSEFSYCSKSMIE